MVGRRRSTAGGMRRQQSEKQEKSSSVRRTQPKPKGPAPQSQAGAPAPKPQQQSSAKRVSQEVQSFQRQEEVTVGRKSDTQINDELSSITRDVDASQLANKKNLKMIKEKELREIIGRMVQRVISERSDNLTDAEQQEVLERTQAALGQSGGRIKELEATIAQLRAMQAEAAKKYDTDAEELHQLRFAVDSQADELDELRARSGQAGDLQALQAENESLRQQLASQKDYVSLAIHAGVVAERETAQRQAQELQGALQQARKESLSLQAQLSAQAGNVNPEALENHIVDLELRIAELETEMDTRPAADVLAALEETNRQLENKINILKQTVSEEDALRRRILELEEDLAARTKSFKRHAAEQEEALKQQALERRESEIDPAPIIAALKRCAEQGASLGLTDQVVTIANSAQVSTVSKISAGVLGALCARIADLMRRIEVYRNDLKGLHAELSKDQRADVQIETMQRELAEARTKIGELEAKLLSGERLRSEVAVERDGLKARLAELEVEIKRLGRDRDAAQSARDAAKKAQDASERQLQAARGALKQSEESMVELRRQLKSAQGQDSQLAELSDGLLALRDMVGILEQERDDLERELAAVRKSSSATQVDQAGLADAEAKLAKLRSQLSLAQEERDGLAAKVVKAERTIDELKAQLADQSQAEVEGDADALAELRARYDAVVSERDGFSGEVSVAKSRIEALEAELAELRKAPAAPSASSAPALTPTAMRTHSISTADGDQRGGHLLLNGQRCDIVKRSGQKEGGAWRIYRNHDGEWKAVSQQPFKDAPRSAEVLCAWRVPGMRGERLLLRLDDGGVHLHAPDGSWSGRLDHLLGSSPAEGRVSSCIDPRMRRSHLVWCTDGGDLVHACEDGGRYGMDRPDSALQIDAHFIDACCWYRVDDLSFNIAAMDQTGRLHHFTLDDDGWCHQYISGEHAPVRVRPGSMCGYAPGALNHLVFANADDGSVHEYWCEKGGWTYQHIGVTAGAPACAGRLVGGYASDRHVIAYRSPANKLAVLEYTHDWHHVQVAQGSTLTDDPDARFLTGEVQAAWRVDGGVEGVTLTNGQWSVPS